MGRGREGRQNKMAARHVEIRRGRKKEGGGEKTEKSWKEGRVVAHPESFQALRIAEGGALIVAVLPIG